MKKIFLIIAVVSISYLAQASWLYWNVGDAGDYSTANSVALFYSATGSYDDAVKVQGWYSIGENAPSTFAYDIGESDTGSYFVELGNYDAASDEKPSSSTGVAHSQLQSYSELSSYIFSSDNMLGMAGMESSWTGGTYSVPEPTSGMMIMMALALLGLKRKQV